MPLSFAQQRLWFLDQLEGPSPTYNIPVALRLSGEVDAAALGAALRRRGRAGTRCCARCSRPRTASRTSGSSTSTSWLRPAGARRSPAEDWPARSAAAARYAFDLAVEVPIRAWLFAAGPGRAGAGPGGAPHRRRRLVEGPLARDLSAAYAARLRGPGAGVGAAAGAVRGLRAVAAGAAGRRGRPGQPDRPGRSATGARRWPGRREELALPADRPRPAVAIAPRAHGAALEVPAELHARLPSWRASRA